MKVVKNMKTRNGFVSNSSSSSFVCIAKPGIIQNILKSEDKFTEKIVKYYLNPTSSKKIILDGNTYEMWIHRIYTEDFGCECDLKESEYEFAYEKWQKFISKLQNLPDVVVKDESC
jgi:hypothetical protein